MVGASFLTNFEKFQTRKFMIKISHYRLLSSGNILRDVWLSISPPPEKKNIEGHMGALWSSSQFLFYLIVSF